MSPKTETIFQSVYERLAVFHDFFKNHTPVIAFSGGKDSFVLSNFYKFMAVKKLSVKPILYHLDHSIRQNEEQEVAIANFMQTTGLKCVIKKKTSRKLPE